MATLVLNARVTALAVGGHIKGLKWLNIVARIVDSDFGGAFSVAQIGIEHTEHTKEQDGRRAERHHADLSD